MAQEKRVFDEEELSDMAVEIVKDLTKMNVALSFKLDIENYAYENDDTEEDTPEKCESTTSDWNAEMTPLQTPLQSFEIYNIVDQKNQKPKYKIMQSPNGTEHSTSRVSNNEVSSMHFGNDILDSSGNSTGNSTDKNDSDTPYLTDSEYHRSSPKVRFTDCASPIKISDKEATVYAAKFNIGQYSKKKKFISPK
eukprot:704112_1